MLEVMKLECSSAGSIMMSFHILFLLVPKAQSVEHTQLFPNTMLSLTHENGPFRGRVLNFYQHLRFNLTNIKDIYCHSTVKVIITSKSLLSVEEQVNVEEDMTFYK